MSTEYVTAEPCSFDRFIETLKPLGLVAIYGEPGTGLIDLHFADFMIHDAYEIRSAAGDRRVLFRRYAGKDISPLLQLIPCWPDTGDEFDAVTA